MCYLLRAGLCRQGSNLLCSGYISQMSRSLWSVWHSQTDDDGLVRMYWATPPCLSHKHNIMSLHHCANGFVLLLIAVGSVFCHQAYSYLASGQRGRNISICLEPSDGKLSNGDFNSSHSVSPLCLGSDPRTPNSHCEIRLSIFGALSCKTNTSRDRI